MRSFRNLLPLAVVALIGAAVLGQATRADAAFKVRVLKSTDSGGTYSDVYDAIDNGSGDTLAGSTTGAISFLYTDSSVSFSIVAAQSKPLFGNGANQAIMDLGVSGSFSSTSAGGSTRFRIDITDTDFGPPSGTFGGPGQLVVKLGQTSGGSASSWTGVINYGVGGNNEFGGIDPATGLFIGPITATTGTPIVTANGDTGTAGYSMSGRYEFQNTVTGFSADNTLTYAPAPGGLVLVLAALPVMGIGAWFRRRQALALAPTVA